jgi:hypothetical protein
MEGFLLLTVLFRFPVVMAVLQLFQAAVSARQFSASQQRAVQ